MPRSRSRSTPDVPVDGNVCTLDLCIGGIPDNPPVQPGTACAENGGNLCSPAAVCTRAFDVLRVGDGAAALASTATPVFLEKRFVSDGALYVTASANPLPMPTLSTPSAAALTVSGTATSEGALSRSSDGQFVVLAGYDAPVGTASLTTSTSSTWNRVAGRVSATGVIDTSTRINALISGSSVRSATSDDGSQFWVGGGASGAVFIQLGATGGVSINAAPTNLRVLNIFGGQLWGSSGSGAFVNVFAIGTGLPTTSGQTATSLPGMPTSSASPYGYAFFDLDAGVAGLDTLYLADDGSLAAGGGIQRWKFDGTTWTLSATLNQVDDGAGPVFRAFRSVTGYVSGTSVILLGTASLPTSGNPITKFVDPGTAAPIGTTLAAAPTNTVYRGITLAAE